MLHLGLVVHLEDSGVSQLLLVRTERAEQVTEAFGEHRDGAVHQIHRGSALFGFLVDAASFLDVMGHVGNVNTHFPQTRLERTDGERIVEVLGILRVDGKGGDFAEVLAFGIVFRSDDVRYLFGGLFHGLGIYIRQSELGQDGVHLGVVVTGLSQDVHYLSDRILGILRPFHHLHYGLVAVLSTLQHVAGDEDVIGQRAVFGEEEGIVFFHFQRSHEGVLGTFQDFNHFSFHLASPALGGERYLHLVAMHGMSRQAFGDEDRFASVIGHEGILSVALALEGSSQDDAVIVQFIMSIFYNLQEVVLHHVVQDIHTKHLQGVSREIQSSENLFCGKIFSGTHLHPGHQLFGQFAFFHVLASFLFFFLRHGSCQFLYFYLQSKQLFLSLYRFNADFPVSLWLIQDFLRNGRKKSIGNRSQRIHWQLSSGRRLGTWYADLGGHSQDQ